MSKGLSLVDQVQQTQQPPASPSSLMMSNVSINESNVPHQPFSVHADRLSSQELSLNDLTAHNTNSSREAPSRLSQNSQPLPNLTREPSWPINAFHVSGTEPKIFPGALSRAQRRDSFAREGRGSVSENDDYLGITIKKGKYQVEKPVS